MNDEQPKKSGCEAEKSDEEENEPEKADEEAEKSDEEMSDED